ncbi:putative aldouronate transport system substrate-binding protein [Paenibacillus sp. UNCCL117]|uniref:hypothetical protein n=1 Tax=unclassified Paenibacillus TaxID=185978 RepID=UPI00088645ED|nr:MULTISPECIES: hypothetical protein [unclassified Paenibacillus]SDE55887.1 putative aldouronate transport system substrate-binding protein [Paenibacillus sp. cl123]SFW66324.1 putative aldouronate transport system substrate-binding protein [Paenibacillus sp. UNCCL117]
MFKLANKPISFLLAGALTTGVALTGCSQNAPVNPETATPQGGQTSAPAADKSIPDPAKRYKISVALNAVVPVDKDGEMLKYFGDKFNTDYDVWNIESNKWDEILNLKFASGEIPDQMFVKGFTGLQKYVKQDLLAEIPEEMVKKNAPNLYKELNETAVKDGLKYGKVGSKLYGLPIPNAVRNRKPIVWNGIWLNNVGITKTPETIQEFEEAMYKFANDDPDKNGKKDTYGLSQTGMQAVYGAYGYLPEIWQERDGKLVYGSVQPEVKQALTMLSKWYKDKVLDPEFITGENQGGYYAFTHAFFNGRIGFSSIGEYYTWKPVLYPGDSKSENYLELKKIKPELADKLVHGLPPKGPEGKLGVSAPNEVNGNFIGFGKQLEKEPDKMAKALQNLEAMNKSYDDFLTSIFGIQGKHWEFNKDNGFPGFINGADAKMLVKMGVMLNPFEPKEFTIKRAKPRFDWADQNQYNVGGISNSLLTPLASESKYKEELLKIEKEAFISIITGDKPISYFDEFVARWKKSGGEQLEKEANEWFATIK